MFSPNILISQMHIKPQMSVLDLGCGDNGHFALPSAKLIGPRGKVFACDIRDRALHNVMSLGKMFGYQNILPVHVDLEKQSSLTPYIFDSQVDRIFCVNTLSQLQDSVHLFEEMKRVLKPEGRLAIVEWKQQHAPIGPSQQAKYQQQDIELLSSHLGFTKLREIDVSPYHYGLLFTV